MKKIPPERCWESPTDTA